jgi:hypothetical protein
LERRTEHNSQIEEEIHVEKIPFLFVDEERLEEFLIEEREEKNRELLRAQKYDVRTQDHVFSKATHNKLNKDTNSSAQTNEKVKNSEKSRFKTRDQKTHAKKIKKEPNRPWEDKKFERKCENFYFDNYQKSGKKKVSPKNEVTLVSSCGSCTRNYGDKKLTIEMCEKIKKQCALYHQSQ